MQRKDSIDLFNFVLPKDKSGQLIEDSARFVLACLQPLSLLRRLGELVHAKATIKGAMNDLVKIVIEEVPVERVALVREVSCQVLEVYHSLDRWSQRPPHERGWRPKDKFAIHDDHSSPFQRAWEVEEVWLEDLREEGHCHIKKFAGLPLSLGAKKRGILCLLFPVNHQIEPHDSAFYGLFCNLASIALEAVSLLEQQRSWNCLLNRKVEERTKELNDSEKRYKALVDNMADTIFTMNMEGRFTLASKKAEALTGYPMNKLLKMTYQDLVDDADLSLVDSQIHRAVRGEEVEPFEIKICNALGNRVHVELSASPIMDAKGQVVGFQGIARDITEREQLKRQLQYASKMEAIGTLAGGIAHDFNNLLMGILGNASLTLMDMDSTNPHYERLKSIEKQVQSGSHLTNQLLGYARKGRYEVRPVNLNQLVQETSETFGRTRKEIVILRQLDEELFAVEADQGQMEQVLLNLLVNAADAMPKGGELILKTNNISHKDIVGNPYELAPGNYVLLTVRDTGIGMDQGTIERIFDPFFTTKEMGRGTGLGLASVYGIVKAHGGYIDVDSEEGKGSTFSICLPATENNIEEVPIKMEKIVKGAETILLVDDEGFVLEVGAQLLRRLGYKVLEANSGKEAIETYRKSNGDISLVILDMIMPNMGGEETYERLKKINSGVKVILSTGYSIDGQAREILERGCNGFIQKPFTLNELSTKMREILEMC